MEAPLVRIFTDGSCLGNPGQGGFAYILRFTDSRGQLYELADGGGCRYTTNNRMELMAVIEAFRRLNQPCRVEVTCDSSYVNDAFNKGWIRKWEQSGFTNCKNPDLWRSLHRLVSKHISVEFFWVRGHAGHGLNERCDTMARAFAHNPDRRDDVYEGQNR